MKIEVLKIDYSDAIPFLLIRHYAKRRCPVSFAFGAFLGNSLIGIVTYGVPSSSPLRIGICGSEFSSRVLELNRLCCESRKNLASTLVGRSLKMLPKPSVVVSFADTSMGHVGYVYQSANFIYTGLSEKRTDWTIEGIELHPQTIADKSRGKENRSEWIRNEYGSAFSLKDRPRKHRYVFFVGTKSQIKSMRKKLAYPVMPYPKGESKRYDALQPVPSQMKFL